MVEIGWQGWFTVGVICTIVAALVRDVVRPDLVMLGGLGLLLLFGIIPPEQAFQGFANPAVLTVGALFVVAAGVQRTEALHFLDAVFFPKAAQASTALPMLMGSTAVLSAFLNNTPIVAMLTPRVQQWASQTGLSSSKLLIPVSYAAILGGMTTLIGTSTNIVVSGLLVSAGYEGLGMFDLSWVGVPAVIVVVIYFTLIGHRLLPDRKQSGQRFEEGLQDCLFEIKVASDSPLEGRSIMESNLRDLKDAYLVHLHRQQHLIPARPDEILQAGDTLTFVGSVSVLERLLQMPGLERAVPALEQNEHETLPLFEAVVAESSDLVGKTLRETAFRENYRGLVLAIQRKNARVNGPLGRIPIKAGDLLLIEAWNGFDKRWNQNRHEFYLVASRRAERDKPLAKKAPVALFILMLMILSFATGILPLVVTAFVAALAMIVTRCLRGREARGSVDVPVLVVIAAALGIGEALEATGVAAAVAHLITGVAAGLGAIAVIAALYVSTNLLTELITNNAAAVLMLPIGLVIARDLGVSPEAIAITIAVAASASFMTPIGYQTNLMVMAAGGYRFRDYTKAGLPVTLMVMAVTITMVSLIWL